MKKTVLLFFYALCSCLAIGHLNIALASDSFNLNQTLELKPIPSEAFQLAKATFLPDYAEGPFSGYSTPIDYNPKGDCDDTSSLYTKNNCTYPKTVVSSSHPKTVVSSSQCPFKPGYYTECKCLPQFKLTSCKSPYILGGVSCEGKYEKCVCPSSVSMYYPNDYCTKYCEGKCIAKSCSPDRDETGCQYGTGSTSDGCGETGCQYGTYSCSDGCGGTRSCCSSKPADPCDGVTGKTCSAGYHCSSYGSCGQCTGCSKDYVDPCSGVRCGSNAYCSGGSCYCNTGYHKSGGSCVKDDTGGGDDGDKCVAGGSKSCTGVTSCGSGQKASSSCKDCNGTTRYTCVSSCVSGGSSSCSGVTSCGSNQVVASSCKDCSGTTRYSCRNKTCAEQGKKDCNGSCISKSSCCGGCGSNQECKNGTCVNKTTSVSCSSYGYSDSPKTPASLWTCNSVTVQGKTCYDCSGKTSQCDYTRCVNNCATGSINSGGTAYDWSYCSVQCSSNPCAF